MLFEVEKDVNPFNVLLVTQQELLQACEGHDTTRLARLGPALQAVYAIRGGELPRELLTVLQVLLMSKRLAKRELGSRAASEVVLIVFICLSL